MRAEMAQGGCGGLLPLSPKFYISWRYGGVVHIQTIEEFLEFVENTCDTDIKTVFMTLVLIVIETAYSGYPSEIDRLWYAKVTISTELEFYLFLCE